MTQSLQYHHYHQKELFVSSWQLMSRRHKRMMTSWRTCPQVYPCRNLQQFESFPQMAALTSCACCRRRGRGRVSLRLCTASVLQCGARPWGAWGWTPRCAGSPRAACGGRWSTHSGRGELRRSWMQTQGKHAFIHGINRACSKDVSLYTNTHTNACTRDSFPHLSFQAKVKLNWLTVKGCHLEEKQDILKSGLFFPTNVHWTPKRTAAVKLLLRPVGQECHS